MLQFGASLAPRWGSECCSFPIWQVSVCFVSPGGGGCYHWDHHHSSRDGIPAQFPKGLPHSSPVHLVAWPRGNLPQVLPQAVSQQPQLVLAQTALSTVRWTCLQGNLLFLTCGEAVRSSTHKSCCCSSSSSSSLLFSPRDYKMTLSLTKAHGMTS